MNYKVYSIDLNILIPEMDERVLKFRRDLVGDWTCRDSRGLDLPKNFQLILEKALTDTIVNNYKGTIKE